MNKVSPATSKIKLLSYTHKITLVGRYVKTLTFQNMFLLYLHEDGKCVDGKLC